ncbi:hypothetical protein J7E26_01805 [Bacillus sp. ISL-51]|nr:hypothetical protein [Bacillus sp. ISL-51]
MKHQLTNKKITDIRLSRKAIAAGVPLIDAVQMKNFLESLSPAQAKNATNGCCQR